SAVHSSDIPRMMKYDSASTDGGVMALIQPLLASSGGQLQDRSIGRFIGVHLQDGGVAFRELDADLHFMEGRDQGCPLGTELDPDLLFEPSTVHGSLLHAARRPEEPKGYPSRARNSFAHLAPSHLEAIEREGIGRRPSTGCLSRSSHRNRSDRPSCA